MNEIFRKFARATAEIVGSPGAFVGGLLLIVVWLVTGPIFRFSDTWQLAVNTLTTVVTFLMVFVIQNSQNRDAKAIHLKLDELLRAVDTARTGLVDLENRPDEELAQIHDEFVHMSQDQLEEIGEKVADMQEDVEEHLQGHGNGATGATDRKPADGPRDD